MVRLFPLQTLTNNNVQDLKLGLRHYRGLVCWSELSIVAYLCVVTWREFMNLLANGTHLAVADLMSMLISQNNDR